MRIDFRRSLLLAASLLFAATLVVSDTNSSPAGALDQGSRASFPRSVDKPGLKVRRQAVRPTSRSATFSRTRAARASRSSRYSRYRRSSSYSRSTSFSRSSRVSRSRSARTPITPAVVGDDVWAKLRQCESGGRYNTNSGNGYYGAYQFSASTWRNLGYPGLPHQAPPEMQDEAARKLQARSGWGQWPACSRRIGVR